MCPSKAGLVNARSKKYGRKMSAVSILTNLREEAALIQWGWKEEPHTQNVSGPIGKTIPLGDARLSQLDPGAQDY